jgi:ArsR family transcriptional regulator, arsenate/arsenite/antimonite-responsive transcriptional repressor
MDMCAPSTKKAVALFHALSDETRLALLGRLKDGEQCVCELTDVMKAAQSRLSFHLKVLKDAGLVEDRREGRWMYYSLSAQAIEEVVWLYRISSSEERFPQKSGAASNCGPGASRVRWKKGSTAQNSNEPGLKESRSSRRGCTLRRMLVICSREPLSILTRSRRLLMAS